MIADLIQFWRKPTKTIVALLRFDYKVPGKTTGEEIKRVMDNGELIMKKGAFKIVAASVVCVDTNHAAI